MTEPELIKIQKRDGRIVDFDQAKIAKAILKAGQASGEFGKNEAERLADVVAHILTKSINGQTPHVEQIQDIVESVLVAANHYPTAKAYILYRQERLKVRQARQILGVEDDLKLPLNILKVIERRYLQHDEFGNPGETPLGMIKRVAKAVAKAEKRTGAAQAWADRFLKMLISFEFVPGGCYFRGAGTKSGQIANCFVLPVEDSLAAIFEAVKWTALVHKTGGGTGFNFSRLRPKGDKIRGGGLASGPTNFIKAFDATTNIVMQGGFHRGANMGILNADHPDIFEFINAKESGEIQNFNISVGASNLYMRAVENNAFWNLLNPRSGEVVQTISARSLFDQITTLAWRTGDPGMIYLDRINQDNPLPNLGRIEATNVCGEQPLHPFDVCNLGSIDLAKFVLANASDLTDLKPRDPKKLIDWNRLESAVRLAVRFLDDGIDIGRYPIRQIAKMARENRRIGLGVMGFADLLYQLMIPYGSDQARQTAEQVMGFVNRIAQDQSQRLALEKGNFPNWPLSIFAENKVNRRNCAVTTIAPTGSISILAETSSGIEPNFALAFVKDVVDERGLFFVNKHFQTTLERLNLYSFDLIREVSKRGSIKDRTDLPSRLKEVFVTAHDISWEWHVRIQAAFQNYTENGVSKTINFPNQASVEEVAKSYRLAWQLGCKGITTYRDQSKSAQILKAGDGSRPTGASGPERIQSKLKITPLKTKLSRSGQCPDCGLPLDAEEGCYTCRSCGYSRCEV